MRELQTLYHGFNLQSVMWDWSQRSQRIVYAAWEQRTHFLVVRCLSEGDGAATCRGFGGGHVSAADATAPRQKAAVTFEQPSLAVLSHTHSGARPKRHASYLYNVPMLRLWQDEKKCAALNSAQCHCYKTWILWTVIDLHVLYKRWIYRILFFCWLNV